MKNKFWLRVGARYWDDDALRGIDFSDVPLNDVELRVEVL